VPTSMKRVMVVTDFSATANAAVPFAYALVKEGGEVHLVHVIEHDDTLSPLYAHYTPDDLASPTKRAKVVADVEERLQALVPGHAEAAGVKTLVACVLYRVVADGIIEESARRKVDAIVIGSHGRRGLTHLLMGSVAEQVLRGAGLPILIIPQRH